MEIGILKKKLLENEALVRKETKVGTGFSKGFILKTNLTSSTELSTRDPHHLCHPVL
jgi:hypothetical protein